MECLVLLGKEAGGEQSGWSLLAMSSVPPWRWTTLKARGLFTYVDKVMVCVGSNSLVKGLCQSVVPEQLIKLFTNKPNNLYINLANHICTTCLSGNHFSLHSLVCRERIPFKRMRRTLATNWMQRTHAEYNDATNTGCFCYAGWAFSSSLRLIDAHRVYALNGLARWRVIVWPTMYANGTTHN